MKQPGFFRSVSHAWDGLVYTVRTQRNAKIHLVAGTLVLLVAGGLGLDTARLSLLVLIIGGVLAAETINTTVEAIVDLLSPEWHAQAKVAKDVAAAGVLILSLTAIVIGLLILGPPLWNWLNTLFGTT
ncbi:MULTISPECIES: diacylglycerol kinase family protein [unclassified Schlesneria]|uniref:diacylglycerol kinase family protein n=1 Tax=Schlesneria TaxID=656899 RepID=UPI0035A14683